MGLTDHNAVQEPCWTGCGYVAKVIGLVGPPLVAALAPPELPSAAHVVFASLSMVVCVCAVVRLAAAGLFSLQVHSLGMGWACSQRPLGCTSTHRLCYNGRFQCSFGLGHFAFLPYCTHDAFQRGSCWTGCVESRGTGVSLFGGLDGWLMIKYSHSSWTQALPRLV